MELKEGQIWRKEGPYSWLKILQILDPEYIGYDGGLHGVRVVYYPPQLKGIQCCGGVCRFVADARIDEDVVSWEDQITHNRHLLGKWKRSEPITPAKELTSGD